MNWKHAYILAGFVFMGCTGKSIKPSQYLKHILDENNGYCSSQVQPGYDITWCYLPQDYMAYQELRNDAPNLEALDSVKAMYAGQCHFRLSFSGNVPFDYSFFSEELPHRLWITRKDGYRSSPSGFFAEPPNGVDGRQICLISLPYGVEEGQDQFELELALPDRQKAIYIPLRIDQLNEPQISHSL